MHSSPNVISLQQQPEMRACRLYHIYLSLPNAFSARTSCKFYPFFPFNFSAPPFFSFQFFHSFFFYSYLRSIFLLVHVFFEWNITGRVQNTQQFSQLFFPNYTIVNLLFKTCKSLSMIIYFNDSSDLQTRAIFFFSSFPPLLYLVAVSLWSREKWTPLLINQPTLFIASSPELVLKVVVWCIHKYL